jgi:DNA repair protein RecN (Recombination protein N)
LLRKLILKNYALVDKIEIEFEPGLTVLTGETGAGKSVIIGGLLLSLGSRADKESIRHGADKASAETHFDISNLSKSKIGKNQFPADHNGQLTFRREIRNSGTSRGFICSQQENVSNIRDLTSRLADFHSQQGQRHLLNIDKHIEFLDSFAGHSNKVEKLREYFDEYNEIKKQLLDAKSNALDFREKLELINFQIDELSKANIKPGEENELACEQRRLESVHILMETSQAVVTAISENDNSITSSLSLLNKQLRNAADLDPALKENADLLSSSLINLNELSRNFQAYMSRLEDDPERLEYINSRLSELYRLKKKYNTDEAGLVARLDELKSQSQGAGDYDTLIKELAEKLGEAKANYHNLAHDISEARLKAAPKLEKKIGSELTDLAMEKSKFKVEFQIESDKNGFDRSGEKVRAFPYGLENIEFYISTNPNEPLRPLVKIASGGEISRIMLALLTVIAGKYKLPTIIFDEIDTGIGGQTAYKLAEKLKELSKKHQVITISHLPAIAEKADHHLAVDKQVKNGRNIITVRKVTGKDVKSELSRMSGKK